MKRGVDLKKYSISVISRSCGIKTPTLRIWEKRYGAFDPERLDNGRRQYGEGDLKKAVLLSKLIDQGHFISDIARLDNVHLEHMLENASDFIKDSNSKNLGHLKKLFAYLDNYKISDVIYEFQHLRSTMSAREFIFDVALPALREVDAFGAKGKYSISQEHIVSTIIRDQLGQLNIPPIQSDGKQVMIATPDGNIHELAIIFANMICKINRVATHYLGTSHPADSIAEVINVLKPKYLVLGVASYDEWDFESQIKQFLEEVNQHLKHSVQVILGGGWKVEIPSFENIKSVEFIPSLEEFEKRMQKL